MLHTINHNSEVAQGCCRVTNGPPTAAGYRSVMMEGQNGSNGAAEQRATVYQTTNRVIDHLSVIETFVIDLIMNPHILFK